MLFLSVQKKGTGVDTIAKIVKQHIPEAIHHFPEDYITDRSQRFMASEIIRESSCVSWVMNCHIR